MDAEGSGVGREERGDLAPPGRQLTPRAGCLERDAVDAVGRGLGDEERILLRADADARELGRRGDDLLAGLACIVERRWGQRGFGGGWLEHPGRWLGAQWAGNSAHWAPSEHTRLRARKAAHKQINAKPPASTRLAGRKRFFCCAAAGSNPCFVLLVKPGTALTFAPAF